MQDTRFIAAADGTRLAYCSQPGASPTIVFLPGYNSDMTGQKAAHLAAWCGARGQAFLRLDYSGHGQSGGAFIDGSIGRWRDDARAVISATTTGPLVLVGSSMGGWIALLLARDLPGQVTGLLGLAAAPDFVTTMTDSMTPVERTTLARDGVLQVPSGYGGTLAITRRLIEEGRDHLLLESTLPLDMPIRLIQGQQDPDVPWRHALKIAAQVRGADVQVTLIKDAGHRLSRASDLAVIERVLAGLIEPAAATA